MDGVEGKSDGGVREAEASSGTKSGVTRVARSLELVLRVVGMGFSLVAVVMVGVDKETEVVAITVVDTLPPLHVSLTAKWYYMSALVYFVVANAIACFYAAVSLVALSIMSTKKTIQNGLTLALLILDLVMVALLFSANGAAAGVGLIGLHGNSHANWKKVCNVFKTFCRYSAAGFAMSMMGSFVFLWLVLLGTLSLHKKSRYFVVANAIACFYAAVSLVALSIMSTKKTIQNGLTLALLILDLVMVALLFSANGAAAGVGLIGLHGNSHANWKKVCNVFKTFCRYSAAGFAMSMMGSFVFLWLVLLGTLSLHKKSR